MTYKSCINEKVFHTIAREIYREFVQGLNGDYKIRPLSRIKLEILRSGSKGGNADYWRGIIKIGRYWLTSREKFRELLIHELGHFVIKNTDFPHKFHGRKFRMLMARYGLKD